MKSLENRRAQLEARKLELTARMRQVLGELDTHEAKDWEEMATEREGDEVLEDLGSAARNEIRMIDAALARMDEGEYGYCVSCGDEIAEERLDLVPATPFCATHAARH